MRYMGGKFHIANALGGEINVRRASGQPYWEPFVGAGWVLDRVPGGKRYASDANEKLIALWQALQDGWIPPISLTEEEYNTIKANQDSMNPALVAFAGFGLSFAGKWFGGYAREDSDRKYAKDARNSLLKLRITGVTFFHANFIGREPPEEAMMIYCDPPYAGTTGYQATGRWDPTPFWWWARELADQGHTVLISEYQAPDDFTCIAEFPKKTEMRTKNGGRETRIERLFIYGDGTPLQRRLI